MFTVAPLWPRAHESDLMSAWSKTNNWFWPLVIHYVVGEYGDLQKLDDSKILVCGDDSSETVE